MSFLNKNLSEEIDESVTKELKQLCADFLGNSWSKCDDNEITITRVTQGHINDIYLCELSDKYQDEEHKKVVIKTVTKIQNEFKMETLPIFINYLLVGEKGLGPKVLGIYSGGIISEFFQSRNYCKQDDLNPKAVELLAKKLALLHTTDGPVKKKRPEPDFVRMMFQEHNEGIFEEFMKGVDLVGWIKSDRVKNEVLRGHDLFVELRLVGKYFDKANSPLVYSHSDFNRGNILVNDDLFDIKFVDLDFSGYNYRGSDIGRYFSNWRQEELLFGYDRYPDDDEMKFFLNCYIDECTRIVGDKYKNNELNSIENLIKETKIFTLIAYLFDSWFCLFQSLIKPDEKDKENYLNMGKVRFHGYLEIKDKFIKEKALPSIDN